MVRKLVLLLILANLLFLAWMLWGRAMLGQPDLAAMPAALNPEKVRLLERYETSAPVDASTVAVAAPTAGKPGQKTAGLALALSPLPAAVSSSPVAVPVSVPASAPVASEKPAVTSPAQVAATEQAATAAEQDCAEWGEFSGDDLQRAQQALATLRLGDSVSQRIETREKGYWVYISPSKKRSDAEKKIEQLKQRGVTDYFLVVEEGKWKYAISLGIFKTEDGAKRRLEALRKKGIRTAKTAPRAGKLKFTVFTMKGLDSGIRDKLTALQREFPDGELKMMACSN